MIGDKKYALHLIPSGILRGKLNIIGNNVVVNPFNLLKEMNDLRKDEIEVTPDNLRISEKAHMTLLYHVKLDEAYSFSSYMRDNETIFNRTQHVVIEKHATHHEGDWKEFFKLMVFNWPQTSQETIFHLFNY